MATARGHCASRNGGPIRRGDRRGGCGEDRHAKRLWRHGGSRGGTSTVHRWHGAKPMTWLMPGSTSEGLRHSRC
jgi:hypothetical protein